MNTDFKKGIATGLIVYSLGVLVTVAVHLIFGWKSPRQLPSSIVPVFVMLVVSGIRVVICGIQLITRKSESAKGELMVHACAAFLIVAIISIMRIKL